MGKKQTTNIQEANFYRKCKKLETTALCKEFNTAEIPSHARNIKVQSLALLREYCA